MRCLRHLLNSVKFAKTEKQRLFPHYHWKSCCEEHDHPCTGSNAVAKSLSISPGWNRHRKQHKNEIFLKICDYSWYLRNVNALKAQCKTNYLSIGCIKNNYFIKIFSVPDLHRWFFWWCYYFTSSGVFNYQLNVMLLCECNLQKKMFRIED